MTGSVSPRSTIVAVWERCNSTSNVPEYTCGRRRHGSVATLRLHAKAGRADALTMLAQRDAPSFLLRNDHVHNCAQQHVLLYSAVCLEAKPLRKQTGITMTVHVQISGTQRTRQMSTTSMVNTVQKERATFSLRG